jgi:hypothetical protein
MDKLKSILSSASGRKVGPPVPPRPPQAAVQKALELTRQLPQPVLNSSTTSATNGHGRTIIYNSTTTHTSRTNISNIGHQQSDSKNDSSSAGRISQADENGNSVQITAINCVDERSKVARTTSSPLILHHKSPIPIPRSSNNQKVSMTLVKIAPSSNDDVNSYTNQMTRNQNSNSHLKNADAKSEKCKEMREKLLNEMFGKSSNLVVEATNPHIKYNNSNNVSNLKRSSSFDVLNDSMGDKSVDKKVVFQEILLSELSELRRETRLSSAKSSPDISQNGNLNIFDMEINEKKSLNTFLSLEDSGVEDEGKMDDWSSGVGDSWDSCKEIENR